MLEPKTLDWSDSRSDTGYETQLENFKNKDKSLDTTKQYSENASTSEEGSSVTSPWITSSSKFNFQSSSNYKSVGEKIEQIRNLYGSVVFLNVFDLTADITGTDFIQFYDPIRIDSIIKYPTNTMLDLEFCCKDDAIKAIERGVGMIKGCLFSVRISRRNYNSNVYMSTSRPKKFEYYAKKNTTTEDQADLVIYTKKVQETEEKVPEIKVEEVPSLQTITENNLEEAAPKIASIEISQSEECNMSQTAKTLDVINTVSLTSSPQMPAHTDLIKSMSMNLTSPQPKKCMTRTPPVKVGKYRNIVRRNENKTESTPAKTCEPSTEEMEKVNKLQRLLIEQFLQEKETLEKIQREREEQERAQREKQEQEERERKQREEEERLEKERLEKEEREREEARLREIEEQKQREEEASKPVRKEVYEKVIYQRSWNDYRDDGYYRSNRYGNDNYRYSSRSGAYRFAKVEKEYTAKTNL